MMRAVLSGLCLLMGACASAPEPAPSGPPVIALTPGLLAPPQARLYADCIAQAAETGAYNTERDGGTLRFTCTGEVAKTFYDGLQKRSADVGSEYVADGLTWRFTNKLIKDSYGVDGCSSNSAGVYQCVVIFNAGDFINRAD
ncbi:MAG: hypothetical protein ABMA14_01545 [Hyphomonadaceae bacterium]